MKHTNTTATRSIWVYVPGRARGTLVEPGKSVELTDAIKADERNGHLPALIKGGFLTPEGRKGSRRRKAADPKPTPRPSPAPDSHLAKQLGAK